MMVSMVDETKEAKAAYKGRVNIAKTLFTHSMKLKCIIAGQLVGEFQCRLFPYVSLH